MSQSLRVGAEVGRVGKAAVTVWYRWLKLEQEALAAEFAKECREGREEGTEDCSRIVMGALRHEFS